MEGEILVLKNDIEYRIDLFILFDLFLEINNSSKLGNLVFYFGRPNTIDLTIKIICTICDRNMHAYGSKSWI